MRRTEIKAGVVYGHRQTWGPPEPVLFLEDGAATVWEGMPGHRAGHRAAPAGTRVGTNCGYAAVVAGSGAGDSDVRAAMRDLDPEGELERFQAGGRPYANALRFTRVRSLSNVHPWADAVAEYEAKREADRKLMVAADARRERQRQVTEAFAAFGVTVTRDRPDAVSLDLSQAEWVLENLRAIEGDTGGTPTYEGER